MEQAVPARLHPGCKTNEEKRKPFLGVAYGLREVTLASKGALATRAHPAAPLIESVPGATKNGFVCKTPWRDPRIASAAQPRQKPKKAAVGKPPTALRKADRVRRKTG
jgi:hypothetical protein